jgi:hypothetical protein
MVGRTRHGWQATVGELDAVLCPRDIAPSADAQVRDGQLWIRHHPRHSPGHSLYHIALVQ